MNIQIISGNVGNDAEVRSLDSGDTVTVFSVAVNEYMGKDKPKRTTWFRVELWNREGIAEYLTKGTKVTVQGRARCSEKEQDGEKRQWWSIDATRGEVVLGGDGGGGGRSNDDDDDDEEEEQPRRKSSSRSSSKGKSSRKRSEPDDDLPF